MKTVPDFRYAIDDLRAAVAGAGRSSFERAGAAGKTGYTERLQVFRAIGYATGWTQGASSDARGGRAPQFPMISNHFLKNMRPADLRYAMEDLRAQGAGDGRRSCIGSVVVKPGGPARSALPRHKPRAGQTRPRQGRRRKKGSFKTVDFWQCFNVKSNPVKPGQTSYLKTL